MQPAFSRDLVTAASSQVVYSSSMNTYRVVNVEPFRAVGLNKLAINEQLGGGLKDQRGIWSNPFLSGYIITKFIKGIYPSPQHTQGLSKAFFFFFFRSLYFLYTELC